MTCSLYLDYQETRKVALAGFSRIHVQLEDIHISHNFLASFLFLGQSQKDGKAKAGIKLLWTIFPQTKTSLLISFHVLSTLRLTDMLKTSVKLKLHALPSPALQTDARVSSKMFAMG